MRRAISLVLPILGLCSILFIPGDAASQVGDDFHLRTNVIFKEVIEKGISISDKQTLKLPAPTMADGLDKAGQTKVLLKLAGEDYALEDLVRDSVVAPHIYKFRDLNAEAADGRGRGVDLWFVAYGNIDLLQATTLQGQFGGGRNKITQLKEADLMRRNIKVKAEAGLEENFAHVVGPILDRVQVSSMNHGMISRTKESMVLAARLDTRFVKDAEFPNQWRSITFQDNGKELLGPPQPYEGAGMYIKLTRLHEPAGAVFVEFHQAFVEPKKWFDAPNMLKSKLPIVIQSDVRTFRKDLGKLKPKS